jgi:ribosomal protein S18 acetylase RimI-like enzyme
MRSRPFAASAHRARAGGILLPLLEPDLGARGAAREAVPMTNPDLVVADEDLEFLEEQINEYNYATTGFRDGRRLVVLLRDAEDRILAGLSGHTWGGACEVKLLWVADGRRHRGLGSGLLRAAEEEARARGCGRIFLSTHSFQAPDFYRKLGYTVAGRFSGYPRGHSQTFLEKEL